MAAAMEKGKLTLQDYTAIVDDVDRAAFTVDQLNHAIHLNGFIRMHRRHKSDILTVLSQMDLLDLRRSTLRDPILPGPAMGVEEVRTAMYAMGREEIVVGVERMGGAGEEVRRLEIGGSECSGGKVVVVKRKRRGRMPRKEGKMKLLCDVPVLLSLPPPPVFQN